MIYLFILEIFVILTGFCLKFGGVYFFVKLFNRAVSFGQLLKAILLFESGALLLYFITPILLWQVRLYIPPPVLFPLLLILFPLVLGVIFVFVTRRFQIFKWQKAVVVFITMFVLITPLALLLSTFVGNMISEIPFIEQEISKTLPTQPFQLYPFNQESLPIQLISSLEKSVLQGYYVFNLRTYLITR